jgi:hypothetical protein
VHRDLECVAERRRGDHPDPQPGERTRTGADHDRLDVLQRGPGLRAHREGGGQQQLAVLARGVHDADGAGVHGVGGHLDDACGHGGRRGVQGQHEHGASLGARLWTTPAGPAERPPFSSVRVPTVAP